MKNRKIIMYLKRKGINTKFKGFKLLYEALSIAIRREELITDIMDYYHMLSAIFCTSVYCVERNIRYAITTTCENKGFDIIDNGTFLSEACLELMATPL